MIIIFFDKSISLLYKNCDRLSLFIWQHLKCLSIFSCIKSIKSKWSTRYQISIVIAVVEYTPGYTRIYKGWETLLSPLQQGSYFFDYRYLSDVKSTQFFKWRFAMWKIYHNNIHNLPRIQYGVRNCRWSIKGCINDSTVFTNLVTQKFC